MRRTIACWIGLLFSSTGMGQQLPHYTQYMLNGYVLNPAITGIENYTDIKMSHRHQWVGIQDAPVTTYFTIHKPIGKSDDRTTPTSYALPGENPRGKSFLDNYEAAKPHHGIGLKIINDATGPLNRFSGYISYAYHVGISGKTSLAAGFEAGITNLSLNRSKLDFGALNPVDPAVFGSRQFNQLKPDFGAGLYLYSARYFVGVSAQQIIPQNIYFADNSLKTSSSRLIPHLFITAGYRFLLTEDISALPSVMFKYVQPTSGQADFNIKLQYLDVFWIGASMRTQDGFAAMTGINVSNKFNVGYAYDYSTSGLRTVSRGTHEIMIGFLIGNEYGDWCPKNVW